MVAVVAESARQYGLLLSEAEVASSSEVLSMELEWGRLEAPLFLHFSAESSSPLLLSLMPPTRDRNGAGEAAKKEADEEKQGAEWMLLDAPSACGDMSRPLSKDRAEAQYKLLGEAEEVRRVGGACLLKCGPLAADSAPRSLSGASPESCCCCVRSRCELGCTRGRCEAAFPSLLTLLEDVERGGDFCLAPPPLDKMAGGRSLPEPPLLCGSCTGESARPRFRRPRVMTSVPRSLGVRRWQKEAGDREDDGAQALMPGGPPLWPPPSASTTGTDPAGVRTTRLSLFRNNACEEEER